MRNLLIVVLMLEPSVALGQSAIFKCVDAEGQVTYQNAACPSDADVAEIREYEPLSHDEAWRAEVERRQRIAEQHAVQSRDLARRQQRQSVARASRTPTQAQRSRQACHAARKERDAARRNAPLWRDVHYLAPWEAKVREACKGMW